MTEADFERELASQGFTEVSTVEREAGGQLPTHTHPFEARALILDGEIHIEVAGTTRRYRAGDIFHLAHGEPHSESYGSLGVRYRVGRKPAATPPPA